MQSGYWGIERGRILGADIIGGGDGMGIAKGVRESVGGLISNGKKQEIGQNLL